MQPLAEKMKMIQNDEEERDSRDSVFSFVPLAGVMLRRSRLL